MLHRAEKIVVITEKIISHGVCEIIDSNGATGYTIIAADGKGSRNIRSTLDNTAVVDDFSNVQIEVIVKDRALAETIMRAIADKYFENYSGIAYVESVEILRLNKF